MTIRDPDSIAKIVRTASDIQRQKIRFMLLIIDDNSSRRNVWYELCSSFDFSAIVVPNMTEAVKSISERQFAAIVIDIDSLPLQISIKFVAQLRDLENKLKRTRTPIIAVSSLDNSEVEELDQINCFLHKPFSPDEFRRMLLSWAYKPDKPNLKILPKNPFQIEAD